MTRLNTSLTQVGRYLLLVLLQCSLANSTTAQSESARLDSLIHRAWDFRSTPRPLDPESGPDDNSLRDLSDEAIALRRTYWAGVMDSLADLDMESLAGADRINYDVFRYIAEDALSQYKFRTYLLPFNAEGGFHTSFAYRANRTLRTAEDVDKYIKQLREFESLTDQQIALMSQGLKDGYVMPCAIVDGFDEAARSYVTPDAESSVFWKPVVVSEQVLDDSLQTRLASEVRVAVTQHVFPAYRKLADFLQNAYIPACREDIGTSLEVDGENYYANRVRHFTTLDISPKQVFDIGMKEVSRIRSEMEAIIEEVGFEGSFDDFLDFLRSDPQFYASTPRELLSAASYFAKKIDGELPGYFGKLPRLSYGVEPVPDAIAPRYTGGRYVPGNAKAGRSGTYWVNTFKLESRPLYVLPSLTLHEAVPGHHLQISLASELEDLPEFRSQYYISAFGEGWALYTEYLGKEMGIYETPYERFGALTYEMWRACRLVVDPGMHAFGWSRDSAVQFMAENTALSLHEINTEINRYIGWPGQAVSYKIGELKIRELRKLAEEKMGRRFDIRAFHDTVLANGSLPLFVLENEITAWIDRELAKAESDKSD